MVPVLVVGALVYKKSAKQKEWVAAAVIAVGCGTYLFSAPPASSHHAAAAAAEAGSAWNGVLGAAFLLGYLFFDGLVSTTQERVFGKNPSSSDPFGPESPVLDQMIWTNVFSCAIAMSTALLSNATGSFAPNLNLLLTSPALLWDVCIFSSASALGLIVLLNTIASFGALTSSLIMTIRQFLSILINAYAFGQFGAVGIDGWVGVGWVSSGIWIKMCRAFDAPKQGAVVFDVNAKEKDGYEPLNNDSVAGPVPMGRGRQMILQYVAPIAAPVVMAILAAPFIAAAKLDLAPPVALDGAVATESTTAAVPQADNVVAVSDSSSSATAAPVDDSSSSDDNYTTDEADDEANAEMDIQAEIEAIEAEIEQEIEQELAEVEAAAGDATLEEDLAAIDAAEAAEVQQSIQAGRWGAQLHDAVNPTCEVDPETSVYQGPVRTGFVSYPRSGNSYMRSLIERTTGYQTSSVYCDPLLKTTFLGECDRTNHFFEKTHYPALGPAAQVAAEATSYYKQFDQVLHLIRNPLDATVSWFHLSASRRVGGLKHADHEFKVEDQRFGATERHRMVDFAHRWARHANYWDLYAPLQRHTLRYEDLKAQPVPRMMSLLTFLLPDEALPSLEKLACMVENDDTHEAYKSARKSDFASWDLWEPELRREVLEITRKPFCRHGYDRMLRTTLGDVEELEGLCDGVVSDQTEYEEDTFREDRKRLVKPKHRLRSIAH